jgi:hypothetical protein
MLKMTYPSNNTLLAPSAVQVLVPNGFLEMETRVLKISAFKVLIHSAQTPTLETETNKSMEMETQETLTSKVLMLLVQTPTLDQETSKSMGMETLETSKVLMLLVQTPTLDQETT